MILSTLLLLAQLDSANVYPGVGRPAVTIPRIDTTVAVDGRLDEAVWQRAALLTGFSQYQPIDGRPAEERTDVLVWYSPTAIHFGIRAYDSEPQAVRATVADRDQIGSDDNVTIYLDTFNDRRRAFFFQVNPYGIQGDGVRSEASGSGFGGNVDDSPDFLWDSRGRRTDQGYVVEVRVPFKSLRYPTADPQTWGINIARQTQRTGYEDTWTDARRANSSFLAQSGTLVGLHDLKAGLVAEIQPFATATAEGARDATTDVFERGSLDPSAGVNLKLALTNMALDATVNPDFSQVEADAGLVTVNERFALFLAERRPFFLEGIELFDTPNRLVHTRQIADPIVGAKFTGKFGRFGVAHLTAVDEAPGGDALFNVTRLRRDLGRNSISGITYTDRTTDDGYNRVLAADTRVIFAQLYFVQAQLGQAWTRDEAGARSSPIWEAQFDRTGRSWGFNYRLTGIGEEFETRSGFVPRNDIIEGHAFNRLTFYGARGAFLETTELRFGPSRIWRYGDFLGDGAIEGEETLDVELRFRGGWEVNTGIGRSFVTFDPAEYEGYEVQTGGGPVPFDAPAELDNAFDASIRIETPTFQTFSAGTSIGYGEVPIFAEAAEGREFEWDGEVNLRPSASIRGELGVTLSRITRRRDGSEFARTIIPRVRVEYQPTRGLFFRFIGEYFSERRAALEHPTTGAPLLVDGQPSGPEELNRFRMEWLAAYEPAPGTVAYLGYGSDFTTDETLSFSGLRPMRDGLFLKVAYLFRQ